MLLPPHTSHLMQPLDVGIFGPLKRAMSGFLDQIGRTGINKIQKTEWLECFVKAHEKTMRYSNIQGGWCGSGIYPLSSLKVLNKLPPSQAKLITLLTSTSIDVITTNLFELALQENASVNCASVQSVNIALKVLLRDNQPLDTPAWKYTT